MTQSRSALPALLLTLFLFSASHLAAGEASLPAGINQEEIDWAMGLESKVKAGYQPSQQEIDQYGNIAKRLQASQQAPTPQPVKTDTASPVSQADLDWAMELQSKITKDGYQASASEIARYTDIYNRYEGNPPPAKQDEDLSWAVDLLRRSRDGYVPTAAERKRYEAIVRLAPATKTGKSKKSAAK